MELYPLVDFKDFPIYSMIGGLGFLLSLMLIIYNLKEHSINKRRKDSLVTLLGMSFLFGLISANLANWFIIPRALDYDIITRIKHGGFSFYFGLIGFIFMSTILLKILKFNVGESLNLIIPSLLLFHAIGRIGCSLGGCCYGKVVDLNVMNLFTIHRFPAREMECVVLFVMFFLFQFIVKKRRLLLYCFLYPIVRFVLEFGRGDLRGQLFTSFLSPAQEISVYIIGTILLIYVIRIVPMILHNN